MKQCEEKFRNSVRKLNIDGNWLVEGICKKAQKSFTAGAADGSEKELDRTAEFYIQNICAKCKKK